jgi:hypothetical protein
MSPSTIDRHELEDRLRSALRARAATTSARPPERFVPGPGSGAAPGATVRPGGPSSRRRALVVGAAAVAVGVLAVAAVALTRDGNDDVSTRPPTPAENGLAVHGPSGSRWFVLDLPGVTPTGAGVEDQGEPAGAGPGPAFQAFRSDAGFGGPALWVETVPPGGDLGPEGSGPGVTRTTIRGRDATMTEVGSTITLSLPGGADGGFYITAVDISADDLVAFADGLRARSDGAGWDATVRPQGLAELPLDDGVSAFGVYAEWSYTGPLDANYELIVRPGGAGVFEDWAREHGSGAGTVKPLTVDGRPGVVIQTESELIALWRPTDTVVADFRVNGTVDDLIADLEALRPVDEAAWRAHLPPDVRSQIPG